MLTLTKLEKRIVLDGAAMVEAAQLASTASAAAQPGGVQPDVESISPEPAAVIESRDGSDSDVADASIAASAQDDEGFVSRAAALSKPTLDDQPLGAIGEDAANGTEVGTVNATDTAGGPLAYAIVFGNDDGVFSIDGATGTISVADNSALDFETNPSYSLTVQASDGVLSDSGVVTITVTDVNEAPLLNNQPLGPVSESAPDNTVVGTVVASDPENDALTYSITGGNDNGAFAIDAVSGEISVANSAVLDFETAPTYALTVQVSDGVLTDSGTVTVALSDANEAPVIADQSLASVAENAGNGAVVGSVSASDPEVDALTYSIIAGNDGGVFTIDAATGVVSVADNSALDFQTTPSYSLTVDVSDGALSSTAIVTVGVLMVNEAPQVNDQLLGTVSESAANGDVVGSVTATDPENDALTYSIVGGNISGTFSIDSFTGVISVANSSALDFETTTSYALTVQASDGSQTGAGTVTINVADVNEAPLISDQTAGTVSEGAANGTAVGAVTATDPEGDALSYAIVGGDPDGAFTIDASTGTISVADSSVLDFETVPSYALTIQASDGALLSSATITVNVSNVNEAPLIADQVLGNVFEEAPNGTVIDTVVATDPEGDALTYSISSGNESGVFAIDAASGAISVADSSQLDFLTMPSYTLTVQASDGEFTDSAQITVNVSDVNQAPVIGDQFLGALAEDAAVGVVVGMVTATDPDNSSLSYTITAGNTGGVFTINGASGEISVVNNNNLDFETTPIYTLTVQASDGILTDTGVVTINVTGVNEAPLVGDQFIGSVAENAPNGSVAGVVSASDPENDTLSYAITGGNDAGIFVINSTSGEISVANNSTLDFENLPSHVLTVEVSDGTLTQSATVTIGVSDVNEAPQIADQSLSVAEAAANGAVVGQVSASDPDGSVLSYTITAGNDAGIFMIDSATGRITVADGTTLDVQVTPSYALTVSVADGEFSDAATVTINVTAVNEAPVVEEEAIVVVDENMPAGTVVATINATDPENSALSYFITNGNEEGLFSVNPATGEIILTGNGNLDFETTTRYTLTVLASDGVRVDAGTVIIDVGNVNEAPVVDSLTVESIPENSANGTLLGTVTASDPEGDALTFSISAGNEDGIFAINATTGELSIANNSALDFETTPQYNLTITAFDGALTGDTAVTIGITEAFRAGLPPEEGGGQNEGATEAGRAVNILGAPAEEHDSLLSGINVNALRMQAEAMEEEAGGGFRIASITTAAGGGMELCSLEAVIEKGCRFAPALTEDSRLDAAGSETLGWKPLNLDGQQGIVDQAFAPSAEPGFEVPPGQFAAAYQAGPQAQNSAPVTAPVVDKAAEAGPAVEPPPPIQPKEE
ncbi:MAG: cadherin repeat domain-containing protein [Gammaproteobacteria bacterium]|nr:cadherin repeat domain-containing protein [Gammaproteobacteria bacterium]